MKKSQMQPVPNLRNWGAEGYPDVDQSEYDQFDKADQDYMRACQESQDGFWDHPEDPGYYERHEKPFKPEKSSKLPDKWEETRNRTPLGHKLYGRWYKERHPKKCYARYRVGYLIKTGKLIRPDRCEQCGKECKPHGHHDDYDKPEEVRWLCAYPCHHIWHENNTALNIDEDTGTVWPFNPDGSLKTEFQTS